ncbi:MAG: hypothetical protein ACKVP0_20680 [Pirellulaceae bacterium]
MATMTTAETSLLERVIVPADPDLPAEAAEWFLSLEFQKADLRRMKKLAAKARAGTLTAAEVEELRGFERIGSFLGLLQSKARISLGKQAKRK